MQSQLDALKKIDVRNDFAKYVYRKSVKQQYAINIRGGSNTSAYALSIGYDKNLENLIRDRYDRFTLNSVNTFTPIKGLDLTAAVIYNTSLTQNNTFGNSYGFVNAGGKYGIFPYARLADDQGNPVTITKNYRNAYIDSVQKLGFVDWTFKPLEEIGLSDNTNKLNNLTLRGEIKYKFNASLNVDAQYQHQSQNTLGRILQSDKSYAVRDRINFYYNPAGSTSSEINPFPKGAILELYNVTLSSSNVRLQGNYNHTYNKHVVTAIGGAEIRETINSSYDRLSFGYDEATGTAITNLDYISSFPVNPTALGSATLPQPSGDVTETVNRFISYYANAAYTYNDRYTISLSGRKDGANIFGVKTNDKVTPFWSAGLGWNLSKEKFYGVSFLPYLKLRTSYGYNGNVYNASAYLTARFQSSFLTGQQSAFITSPPNPELRWENVRNINTGIDFAFTKDIITGTFEVYQKDGLDLIESIPLAVSTGFTSFKGNAAATRTKGFDLTLNTQNLMSVFKWNTNFLLSYQTDKVVHVDNTYSAKTLVGGGTTGTPDFAGLLAIVGKPLYGVYSYRSGGIDKNGNPLGYLNDTLSTDYQSILAASSLKNLQFFGTSRPKWFGSIRNTFSWKNFSVTANITFKLGYYFRRSSVNLNYQDDLEGDHSHSDYAKRWQKPGDELLKTVPSLVYPSDNNRNEFYQGSSVLIEKGDHIRLQDAGFQYTLSRDSYKKLPFSVIQLYVYVNNLGLLWKANHDGIDPDFNDNGVNRISPNPKTVSLGCRINF